MTQLSDITKDFTDALSKITSYVPGFVSNFQKADSKLRGQEDNLINGYDVPFAGMGSMMFAHATDNNIQLAGRVEQKLQEFVTASDNTNKQIQSANDHYNGQIDNTMPPLAMAGVDGDPLEHYNYGWKQVNSILKEGVLAYYIDIAGVLELGLPFLLNNLKSTRDGVKSDITYQAQQKIDGYNQQLNKLKKQDPYNYEGQAPYKQEIDDEEGKKSEALYEVDQIYNVQSDSFTGWYNELNTLLDNYKLSLLWTSATADVTVSDLLLDLQNAPSPIVIYQTSNGGIVVLVNTMNDGLSAQQNALLVQQAIAQYSSLNNLNNPKVTILGYKGGTDVVQNLAHDNNPFQIENVVLVGGQVTMQREGGINYTVYASPGDNDAGTGGASLDPSNPANQASYGVDAGEIVLGAATGGPAGAGVAFGEVVAGTVIPAWAGSNSSDVSGAANGGMYFQPPTTAGPVGQMPGTDNLYEVPVEPGMASSNWGLSWNYPYVRVHHVNYLQSSYLGTQGIPDPNGNGNTILAGVNPLSPPTYYYPQQ